MPRLASPNLAPVALFRRPSPRAAKSGNSSLVASRAAVSCRQSTSPPARSDLASLPDLAQITQTRIFPARLRQFVQVAPDRLPLRFACLDVPVALTNRFSPQSEKKHNRIIHLPAGDHRERVPVARFQFGKGNTPIHTPQALVWQAPAVTRLDRPVAVGPHPRKRRHPRLPFRPLGRAILKDESARADVPGGIDIHAVKIIKGLSGVVVAVDRLLAAPGEIEQAFDRRAGPFNHSLVDNNLVAPLLKQG